MTGVFSAAILSQISGQSTAPLATQSTPAGVTTPAAATTTGAAASSKKPSSTGSSGSASKPTASKAAALSVRAGWAGAALGALVGVTMF